MRGTILGYDESTSSGVITSEGGERVKFVLSSWKGNGPPRPGTSVDYTLADEMASDIYPVPGRSNPLGQFEAEQPAEKQALVYGIVSLVSAVLTFVMGPLAIITVVVGIIFGIKGKNIGRGLPDQTGYYLSMAGLIISIVAIVLVVFALVACGAFLGGMSMLGGIY